MENNKLYELDNLMTKKSQRCDNIFAAWTLIDNCVKEVYGIRLDKLLEFWESHNQES